MTTEKSADTTTNCSGLDDSRSPLNRYDLGPRYEQGFSAPDIIEKADGRFVLYDEVLPLLKIIQLQEALLAKQAAEMEAIGAGGVSGKRITDDGALDALQACERTYHQMIVRGTPEDCAAHGAARVRFWRVFGGRS